MKKKLLQGLSLVEKNRGYQALLSFGVKEKYFLRIFALLLLFAALLYPYPKIAMWFGFLIAAYSAVSNDSIQTIGTFIVSNGKRKWWVLWLFIGGIFICTITYSWMNFAGDVSYQRLTSKGFSTAPESFSFFQIAAPIALLLLTRLRMPVSTTFMLLGIFSSDLGSVASVGQKSVIGYALAFSLAFGLWFLFDKMFKKLNEGEAHKLWFVFQWLISGSLWSLWIMHDAANIAIFLPRSLSFLQFIVFTSAVFFGLGALFYSRGDKIQEIVNEKSQTQDVRVATCIDVVYTFILLIFINMSKIPMSTTWVFIGLLGGRELAIALKKKNKMELKSTLNLVARDVFLAAIGLIISIVLAIISNKSLLT